MSELDRFAIEREVGRGGMGVVSYALDTKLERDVALKELTLPPTMTLQRAAESIERFKREAQTSAMLDSPHIVEVLDAFSEGIRHFIVMEYVEGPTLDKVLANGPLPLEAAVGVAEQILEALTVAHAAGIVHRDLKPENIFVQDDGVAKVADFGVARLTTGDDVGLTRAGQVLGTIGYMPPEQVRGEDVDGRSDIFAVGVILYQMLVGANPFHSDQPTTSMYKISYEDPPALDPFIPELPVHITPLLAKAMAKDPDLRYQSAEEMLSDLRSGTAPDISAVLAASAARIAEKEKAAAETPAIAQPSTSWKDRLPLKLDKKVWIALGAAAVLLLGAGVGFSAINQQREQQRQQQVMAQRAAIIAEAREAELLVAKAKTVRASMDSAANGLRRRVSISKSAVSAWNAQWKAKLDKYKARAAKVEAHNSAERAHAQEPVTPVSTWDPYWQQWTETYPPAYEPDYWDSPKYPKAPAKLRIDTKAEIAAIDKVVADASALQAELTSASVGVHYFQVVYKKANEVSLALSASAAALKATTIGVAWEDARRGRILNGDKVNAWNAQGADQAIQQLDQQMLQTVKNYQLSAADLSATSTPSLTSAPAPPK